MLTDKENNEESHCPASAEISSPLALISLAVPGVLLKKCLPTITTANR